MFRKSLNLRNVAMIACLAVSVMFLGCKKDSKEEDHPEIGSGFSYHDNQVRVKTRYNYSADFHGWEIVGGSFEITDFDVSPGQDPAGCLRIGVTTTMDKDNHFTFRCGRHATKEVANSFNEKCPPPKNTFNHTAGELNFWVKGTMTLTFKKEGTYTFPNTFFAQGHTLDGLVEKNNWWFGNDDMEYGGNCIGVIHSNLYFYFRRGAPEHTTTYYQPVNAVDLILVIDQ